MAFLIGTDEAGYGPNLGPLVLGISIWEVPDSLLATDLYELLRDSISPNKVKPADALLAITDSKKIYQSKGKKDLLEQALFASLNCIEDSNHDELTWKNLLHSQTNVQPSFLESIPWYSGFDCQLPLDAGQQEIESKSQRFEENLQQHDIALIDLRCCLVFPQQFNQFLDTQGNKSQLLSHYTFLLLQECMTNLPPGNVSILCDKHGGRNQYAAMLQQSFPDHFIEVLEESSAISRYRWQAEKQQTNIEFRAKGDRFLPAALASIAAKYLRELTMLAFNQFWIKQLPELKPTAGYPQDAKRFAKEVRPLLNQLQIADEIFWRNK